MKCYFVGVKISMFVNVKSLIVLLVCEKSKVVSTIPTTPVKRIAVEIADTETVIMLIEVGCTLSQVTSMST